MIVNRPKLSNTPFPPPLDALLSADNATGGRIAAPSYNSPAPAPAPVCPSMSGPALLAAVLLASTVAQALSE